MINWAYVRTMHLFIVHYISPLLFKISEIYKLHEIPYEMLQKCYKFYYTTVITYKVI